MEAMLTLRITRSFTLTLLCAAAALAQDFTDLSARAKAARDANDAKTAIALYKQAVQLRPDWAEGWWMAGSLAYDAGSCEDGAESLRHLVALRPKVGLSWALLGLCEYENRDYTRAFDHIRQALTMGIGDQPQMTLVLQFHEAALLTRMRRFAAALESYTQFIPSKVSDENVLVGLALAQLRYALTPEEAPAERRDFFIAAGRGLSALLTRDGSVAEAAYADLLKRYPADADAHYANGYFLFGSDADGAIAQWNRAIAINPTHAPAHAMLSWAYSLRDEKKLAAAHAEAALAKDADLTVARIVLGRSLIEQRRIDAGIEHLTRAVALEPSNLEAHLALATAWSEAGRRQQAQQERQLCLKLQAGAVARP